MTSSNVDTVYAEYPFLSKIISRAKTVKVQVKRFDQEFIEKSAIVRYMDERHECKFYLLNERGEIVARVGEKLDWWERLLLLTTHDETAGQALFRIGEDARRVRYAIFILNANPTFIFYKVPRGFTNAVEWLDSIVSEDREELTQL